MKCVIACCESKCVKIGENKMCSLQLIVDLHSAISHYQIGRDAI